MKYEKIRELKDEKFRRLTGVKKVTFSRMIGILEISDQAKKVRGGRKNTLCLEDQLLLSLEYISGIPDLFSCQSKLRRERKHSL